MSQIEAPLALAVKQQEQQQAQQQEAYDALLQMARRRTGRVPPELLANHVVEICREADWPVKHAAMEALLRRFGFARKDALRVASRPEKGAALGLYQTRPRRSSVRPYQTLLRSLAPLEGSCDCPDFLRSSLGLCKHLLVVLDALAARPRKLAQALREGASAKRRAAYLSWDPIRPLHGRGNWLERVRLHLATPVRESAKPGHSAKAKKTIRTTKTARSREPERVRRARVHFVPDGARYGRLKNAWEDHPERRLALVEDLLGLQDSAAESAAIDPALQVLLTGEKQRLKSLREAKRGPRPSLRGLRRRLYPYQREGVARLLEAERLLLADDMGLGKTIQAAAACHALFRAGRVRRGLVIAPASLKSQWEREWGDTTKVPVAVVEGAPAERARRYRETRDGFLVTNYEQVLRDLDVILAWDPEIVVLDEAQRIKNWETRTAAFVKRLRPRYRLVLTGTPMENRLEELASIMDWVDDHALEPKWRLVPWHSMFDDGSGARAGGLGKGAHGSGESAGGFGQKRGARHLDVLRERLAPRMLRRVRSEVLSQLPPRTDTVIPTPMTQARHEEHDALDQPIAVLAQRARKRPLTQAEFLRLMSLLTTKRIIANGLAQHHFADVWPGIERARPNEALLASLSSPKLAEARALVAALTVEQERKVVVFSQWRRMLRLVHWAVGDVLADAGLRAVFFTGQESARKRTRNLVDFHDDPAARVLFASDAGGVGLNLQRAASACVVLDLPWNPAVLEQRIGRIYRLGQKRPIDVYSLVSQDSIEARIASIVSDKRALFRGLFDGASDSVHFERSGGFVGGLEQLVGPHAETAAPEAVAGARAGESAETRAGLGSDAAAKTEDEDEDGVEEAADAALETWLGAGGGDDDPGDDDTNNGDNTYNTYHGNNGNGNGNNGEGSAARTSVDAALPAEQVAGAGRAAHLDVAALFATLEVERTASGGLRIEAPADAADTLASLFEGFAGALRRATR